MKKSVPKLLAIVCVLGWSIAAHATGASFDFDSLPQYAEYNPAGSPANPLTLTDNGITATFLTDVTVFPNAIYGPGKNPFIPDGHLNVLTNTVVDDSITVQFSQVFTSAVINFATDDTGTSITPITVHDSSISQSYFGSYPPEGGFPSGTLHFVDPNGFNTLYLSDTSPAGNGFIYISSIAVPEPSSLVGIGIGLLVLLLLWHPRRSRTAA